MCYPKAHLLFIISLRPSSPSLLWAGLDLIFWRVRELCSFARAALTKCCKLGDSIDRNLFSYSSGGENFKMQVSADLVSLRPFCWACRWTHLPAVSSHGFSLFPFVFGFSLSVQTPCSYSTTLRLDWGPLKGLILTYLLEGPISNHIHILEVLGLRTST